MKNKHFLSFLVVLLLISAACVAQGQLPMEEKAQMAVGMRSNGKIYVVVAVVVAILIGIFLYLFSLDKKISRLEKGQNDR